MHQAGVAVLKEGEDAVADAPPRVVLETRGAVAEVTDCVRFVPSEASGELDVEVPASGLVVRAGDAQVEVWVRRFSSLYPGPVLGTLEAGRAGGLELRPDKAPQPWYAKLRSDTPFSACTAA